jgi:hypothetical protein
MVRRKAPLIFGENLTEKLEKLCESLGLGELNPTEELEIPASRPRGLDAASTVRESREERASRAASK